MNTGRQQAGLLKQGSLRIACRAGAVVFLVAFWFDGGLFTLATGSVFWVLLELGAERRPRIEQRCVMRDA